MKRWLLFVLAGAACYWLLKEPPPRRPAADRGRSFGPGAGHEQALLDEALDESFPASDPPAMTRPTH